MATVSVRYIVDDVDAAINFNATIWLSRLSCILPRPLPCSTAGI